MFVGPLPVNTTAPVEGEKIPKEPLAVNGVPVPVIVKVFEPLALIV